MIFFGVVALCLGSFTLLCWLMWEDMTKLARFIRKQDDRISKLEVNEFSQDARLDAHRKHLIKIKHDVRELGKDVGWDDSGRSTQVMDASQIRDLATKSKEPPDDDPPPTAT